jgi:hypothetical protein
MRSMTGVSQAVDSLRGEAQRRVGLENEKIGHAGKRPLNT